MLLKKKQFQSIMTCDRDQKSAFVSFHSPPSPSPAKGLSVCWALGLLGLAGGVQAEESTGQGQGRRVEPISVESESSLGPRWEALPALGRRVNGNFRAHCFATWWSPGTPLPKTAEKNKTTFQCSVGLEFCCFWMRDCPLTAEFPLHDA